jgi:hypothetical protein
MSALNKHRVWCDTDSKWEYVWLESDAAAPTTCPTDPVGHTIDSAKSSIIDTTEGQSVELLGISTTSSEHLKVEVEPREGTGQNYYSPNMCDRTTWYENSTLVSEYALTDTDGNRLTWDTDGNHDGPWVDLTHGKIFNEDELTAANGDLLLVVEVSTDGGTNWSTQTENTFNGTDGDYSVDYKLGTVTFNTALDVGNQVRASFSKAPETMLFSIVPPTGKRIRLIHVESQMSDDVEFTADVEYQIWAYYPLLVAPPTKIQVKTNKYKTIMDFLYESTGVYPRFPALDVTGPRGIPKDIIVVPFNYTASRDIADSGGVEIRMVCGAEFGGYVCNCTFYCLLEDE